MSDITVKDTSVKALQELASTNVPSMDLKHFDQQQLQVATYLAKRFPRDEFEVEKRIRLTCSRPKFAATAAYAYPRGKEMVKGPSIHMAKMLARAYGNIQYEIIELERTKDYTKFKAYAWDLEAGINNGVIFTVDHKISTRFGDKVLTDPREIYELGMNYGSRRLRKCILALIPEEVINEAMELCEATLKKGDSQMPLPDLIKKMVVEYDKIGVSKEMLEKYLKHPMENTNVDEITNLRSIFKTIYDREGKREDYFEIPKLTQSKANELTDLLETTP